MQAAERLRFPFELTPLRFRGEHSGAEYLERHAAARVRLLRLIDDAHTAFAEAAHDAILPNKFAGSSRTSGLKTFENTPYRRPQRLHAL